MLIPKKYFDFEYRFSPWLTGKIWQCIKKNQKWKQRWQHQSILRNSICFWSLFKQAMIIVAWSNLLIDSATGICWVFSKQAMIAEWLYKCSLSKAEWRSCSTYFIDVWCNRIIKHNIKIKVTFFYIGVIVYLLSNMTLWRNDSLTSIHQYWGILYWMFSEILFCGEH